MSRLKSRLLFLSSISNTFESYMAIIMVMNNININNNNKKKKKKKKKKKN